MSLTGSERLCKKISEHIPDEIQMQIDAVNFVSIAMQPEGEP